MEQVQTTNPSDKPIGDAPGGGENTNVSYSGATTISADEEITGKTYSSTKGAENALLISGGKVVLDGVLVEKTGDDSGDSSDFYGTNAAILAYNDADVTITSSRVRTDGGHANAVFAYGGAVIDISDSTINTSSNNSGGIMVTGGGTINASNLDVSTEGNSAAPIRSDRGGGTITVENGSYLSQGVGSPAIYSTANITVKRASLTSQVSEGVVIEGKNSVTLENTTLEATNNKLNGQSETYKTIFIYQSMSGDASEGTGTFTAEGSLITSNNGDVFFVTNTDALINLSGNKFVQNDENGAFLRASTSAWGNAGRNGGQVTLNATDQEIIGDVAVDSISSLTMQMEHSYFKGSFIGDGNVSLTVSEDSIVVLTADSYITELNDSDSSYENIYSNGYKLYVGGAEVAVNTEAAPESFLEFDESNLVGEEVEVIAETTTSVPTNSSSGFPTWGYFVIGGGIIALIIAIVVVCVMARKKKASSTLPTRPDNSMDTPNIADAMGMNTGSVGGSANSSTSGSVGGSDSGSVDRSANTNGDSNPFEKPDHPPVFGNNG